MSDVPSSEATGASRDNSEETSNDVSTTSADLIDLRDSAGGDGAARHDDAVDGNRSETLYASRGDGAPTEDPSRDDGVSRDSGGVGNAVGSMSAAQSTNSATPANPSTPVVPSTSFNSGTVRPSTPVDPSAAINSSSSPTPMSAQASVDAVPPAPSEPVPTEPAPTEPAPTEPAHSVDASMAHPAGSATRAAAAQKAAAESSGGGEIPVVELPSDLPGTPHSDGPQSELPGSEPISVAAEETAPVAEAATSIYDLLDQATTTSHPSSSRDLPRIIAVANQKGGVGKTTSTINMAACMADLGYRVLVVDFDPQANASTGLGLDPRSVEQSMYDVILRDTPIKDIMVQAGMENLWIAPSSLDLAGAEIELVPAFSRERKLANALDEIMPEMDYVFIDCPPSLGLLTVNAFTAASEVLVPIQCEYYALEGLGQLLRNVELVQRNLNPGLEVSVIILVMFDGRTKLASQVVEEVRSHFGDKVAQQVVPRSVRLSEAPSYGQPIIAFDPKSRGAIAYRELAKEVSGGPANRTR